MRCGNGAEAESPAGACRRGTRQAFTNPVVGSDRLLEDPGWKLEGDPGWRGLNDADRPAEPRVICDNADASWC